MARHNPDSAFAWNQRLTEAHGKAIKSVEAAGGSFENWMKFLSGPRAAQLGLLVMGKLKLALSPCQTHVPHLVPDWSIEVMEDAEPVEFDPAKLGFHGFLNEGEPFVTGDVMRARGEERNIGLGLSDVPRLLGEDGKGLKTIPEELRGKVYIVLSKTVLQSRSGDLYVPHLGWRIDRWMLCFLGFDFHWNSDGRLVSYE